MDAYLLHVIHHISIAAARIKKNNDALKADREAAAPRDQGFTRAKVLPAKVHSDLTSQLIRLLRHPPLQSRHLLLHSC